MQEFETDRLIKEKFTEHIKLNCGNNKSKTYILPMLLSSNFKFYSDFTPTQLRGIFIGDQAAEPAIENKILLLYKFKGTTNYFSLENKLITHPLFEYYYEPDKLHTMYVFKVPDNLEKDYKLFLDWKISSFSNDYKKQVLNFHRQDSNSLVYKILYKDKKYKKELEQNLQTKIDDNSELSSVPVWYIEYYQKEFNMRTSRQKIEEANNEFKYEQ